MEYTEIGDAVGDGPTEDDTDSATDDSKGDGFDEELGADVALFGADGFAETDFASAFGHCCEHHVHDTDTADDKRYASDSAEKESECAGDT